MKDSLMFQAFVIICAASTTFQIYEDMCFFSNDTWGPYKTEENCGIRARQMVLEVTEGSLNETTFFVLGFPEQIYAEGFCKKLDEDPEA
jgi:hypothetical protein